MPQIPTTMPLLKNQPLYGDYREAPPSDVCWYERTPKTTYGNHITIVAAKLAIGILAFEVFLVAFLICGILYKIL